MANTNPLFATDGQLGANFQDVFTPSATSGYDNPPFAPGTKRTGSDGSEWIYARFIGAANLGDTVILDRNANAQQITTALAAAGVGRVGVVQVATGVPAPVTANGATTYSFGWVAVEGDDLGVNVATGIGAGVGLATSAVPGVLGPIVGGQTTIAGLSTNVANTSGAAAVTSCAASRTRLIN